MALFDFLTGGTNTSALSGGAAKADHLLRMGTKLGLKDIKQGQQEYTPNFQEAANTFAPFIQSGTALNGLYTDALGGNGQTGYDNALSAFHTAPGYSFLQQQGEQAALRNNAAMGGVASGNTLTDLAKFDTGLADQSYQQWLDNLFRGGTQGLTAAGGKSSALQNLGQQQATSAAQRADIRTGGFGARATNQSSLGAGLQSQTAADQASQLSLLNSILGAGAKVGGAYFGA